MNASLHTYVKQLKQILSALVAAAGRMPRRSLVKVPHWHQTTGRGTAKRAEASIEHKSRRFPSWCCFIELVRCMMVMNWFTTGRTLEQTNFSERIDRTS